jgi:hypothetical protein
MMGEENRPPRMNQTIKNAFAEAVYRRNQHPIDSSRTFQPAADITPGKQ